MHFRRWDEVTSIYHSGYEATLDKAFERAVDNLKATADAGSYETMRDSYRLVQRAIFKGEGYRFEFLRVPVSR